jgi:hypothetical protein
MKMKGTHILSVFMYAYLLAFQLNFTSSINVFVKQEYILKLIMCFVGKFKSNELILECKL